jgi:NAD-dependent deacetylase
MNKKKIVVLTGAGISAESGISTFRDSNGLWENHDVMDVASIDGWHKNPKLVLEFYNQRRAQLSSVEPNEGHKALAQLEEHFEVVIITQNVDNLHERAGSSHIVHLHGELNKVRSSVKEELILDWTGKSLELGDLCEFGSQLRPHIVWFGEAVPMMEVAMKHTLEADIFLVVGTSMVVYPAASLIDYVSQEVPKYIIDPNIPDVSKKPNMKFVAEKGSIGVPLVAKELISKYN